MTGIKGMKNKGMFKKGQKSWLTGKRGKLEGKKAFDYDIYECPEELKGQLKIGDFFG